MANINREYDGQTKLKEWWKVVRDNADLMNDQTEKHISGEADRHSAEDLDYSGTVEGAATVKEAVEAVHTEVAQKQNEWLATTAGTSTAYTAVLDPAPTEMYVGMRVTIIPHVTSTSKNATLNVNGLGAKEIRQRSSNTNIALLAEAKDFLVAGKPAGLMYDGTYWVMTEFSRPAWWDIRSKPDLVQPSNIKAGENVSVSVSGTNVTISAEKTPVADNLTSASATTALSAKQGKVLNEKIAELQTEADGKLDASDLIAGNNVDIAVSDGKVTISAAGGSGGSGGVDIVDYLDSTSKISALSANQGRVLDEKIAEVNSDLESQISAKADATHEHTSADISDFPTLQAGENIEVSRDGNNVTISAPTVDSKLEADDIVAGENIALEKADGKVTVSATGSSFKVGDMLTTMRTDLDDSWLLCNGAIVSAEEYPELEPLCASDVENRWSYSYPAPCSTSAYSAFNEECLAVPYLEDSYYGIAFTTDPTSANWTKLSQLSSSSYPISLSYVNGYWVYTVSSTIASDSIMGYYKRSLLDDDEEWQSLSPLYFQKRNSLADRRMLYINGYYVLFQKYVYSGFEYYIQYSPTIDFTERSYTTISLSTNDHIPYELIDIPEKQKVILPLYSASESRIGLYPLSYEELFSGSSMSLDNKIADTASLRKVNGKYISINGSEIWYKDSADGEAKTVTPDATTTRNYNNIIYANGYWLLHDSTNNCMLYSKDFENWYVNTEVSNVSGGIMNSQNCFVALCGDTWRATKPGERVLPTVAGGIDGYTYIKAK